MHVHSELPFNSTPIGKLYMLQANPALESKSTNYHTCCAGSLAGIDANLGFFCIASVAGGGPPGGSGGGAAGGLAAFFDGGGPRGGPGGGGGGGGASEVSPFSVEPEINCTL